MSLAPIKMIPAYRYGSATPWGGNRLQTMFNKPIPCQTTGESLEVSVIDGLNSRDENGTTLQELIGRYGIALVGTNVKGDFPLLLKIIDTADTLSVQVHPDNEYAKANENKLGKTEAWIILYAEEGAEIIYGMREGVTKQELRTACEQGSSVETLLNRVKVKKGDVYYIPAGMVHSVGRGIMLYEVQQSSDVTYRFYDWDRLDPDGNKRELHLKKALDVTDVGMHLDTCTPQVIETGENSTRYLLLQNDFFTVERCHLHNEMRIRGDIRCFMMLTALNDFTMRCAGEEKPLHAGETLFLPADMIHFTLCGEGDILISSPKV